MLPQIGSAILRNPMRHHNATHIEVETVRTLDQFQKVIALRAMTYWRDHDTPYEEEFDGNDLCGLHLLATVHGQPAASLRLRFFAGFCKIERVCVDHRHRGGAVLHHIMAHAADIASRKGYRRLIAHMQVELKDMWNHVMHCTIDESSVWQAWGLSFYTVEIPLPEHPEAIQADSDPFVLLRPEGDWDRPGVLDPGQRSGREAA
jgi:predicted GNAT family N-acyltransferase